MDRCPNLTPNRKKRMSERIDWESLPAELRRAVEARTGAVISVEPVEEGLNCSVALTIDTAQNGPLFFKGVRESDADGVAGLLNEEKINECVAGIGPAVRYGFRAAGWFCLAFVHIEGRHADLGSGSDDLAAVTFTMNRMAGLRLPDMHIPHITERLAGFLDPGESDLLSEQSLLHTDTNPHNIMITRGGVAYVIDWAMPALGPSWIDPAYTAVRLMEYGQTADEAISWLADFPHWRQAHSKSVEAFVLATCRHWTACVGGKGASASNDRFRALLGFPHQTPSVKRGRRTRAV